MAIYTLLTLGTTVAGGPFVGWVCQHWSPRTGLAFAGGVTVTAAVALAAPLPSRRLARAALPNEALPNEAVSKPAAFSSDQVV
jgi:hypothetical protein